MVDGRLFTGSHDSTVKVWDISDIQEEANANKADEEDDDDELDDETKIIFDEDYPYGDEAFDENGSMFLENDETEDTKKTRRDELMDMV